MNDTPNQQVLQPAGAPVGRTGVYVQQNTAVPQEDVGMSAKAVDTLSSCKWYRKLNSVE